MDSKSGLGPGNDLDQLPGRHLLKKRGLSAHEARDAAAGPIDLLAVFSKVMVSGRGKPFPLQGFKQQGNAVFACVPDDQSPFSLQANSARRPK
jgi:hypothetical protein